MKRGIYVILSSIILALLLLSGIIAQVNAAPVVPGYTVEVFSTRLSMPTSLAMDSNGNIYVASGGGTSSARRIRKVTPDGSHTVYGDAVIDPDGVAIGAGDIVYAAGGSYVNKLQPPDPNSIIASGFGNLNRMTSDLLDTLYIADMGSGGSNNDGVVWKVSTSGTKSALVTGLANPNSISYRFQDSTIWLADIVNVNLTPSTTRVYTIDSSGTYHLFSELNTVLRGLSVSPSGDIFGMLNGTDLIQFNDDGTYNTIGSGFDFAPGSMAFGSNGEFFISEMNLGQILKLNPVPIPSAALLLVSGMAGLVMLKRRQK